MRMKKEHATRVANVVMIAVACLVGYGEWSAAAGAGAAARTAAQPPYAETWTRVRDAHAQHAVDWSAGMAEVGREVEGMADALAADDAAAYRVHLQRAEALGAVAARPRTRADLIAGARGRYEVKYPEHAAAATAATAATPPMTGDAEASIDFE